MVTADRRLRLLGVDRKHCALLAPTDPVRSRWRIRFKIGPQVPSTEWRQELERELSHRELRRMLRYRYTLSADHASPQYRYAYVRPLGRVWRRLRSLFQSARLFIEADVPPGPVHVQLAHRELADMIRVTNEKVIRENDQRTQARVARRAALRSMSRAISAVERAERATQGLPLVLDFARAEGAGPDESTSRDRKAQ